MITSCALQLSFTQGVIWMFLCSEGKDLESQDASFEFQIYNGHLLCHAAKDPSYRLYYMNKVTHKAILL